MLLHTFYNRHLAQTSYLIGCQESGEALVIDPARDIRPYLELARREGLRITQVTETHIHADFASGLRELATRTGAQLYLSAEGGEDWQYAFANQHTTLLHDGDTWCVGNILLKAIHTPGHTPEHLIFEFTDTKRGSQPLGLFTGDCLFVGDVGRPDLLETAAGIVGSKEIGARGQYKNIQYLKTLPDYFMILPGHGAGSACGKALGAVPSSTLGYEKLFNPAFQFTDESAFVSWLLSNQPETPPYFAQMKRINRLGVPLLNETELPLPMEMFVLHEVLQSGAVVIDTRPSAAFAQAHIPKTISIPPSTKFSTYAGWVIDYQKPVYLIAPPAAVPGLVRELRAIGVDRIGGYFPEDEVEASLDSSSGRLPCVDPTEAMAIMQQGADFLDVRSHSEYSEEHINGAQHLFYGYALQSELPRNRPLLVYCTTGYRSQVASSLLLARGYDNVINMRGGLNAWKSAGLPVVTESGE